jgi:hypothetical protein
MNYLITLAPSIIAALALTFSYLQNRDAKKAEIKKILYAKQIDALCAIYEKLSVYVRSIDTQTDLAVANIDTASIDHAHEEFLSTYYKYSVFVPIAIEGMFQRYLEISTVTSKSMTIEQMMNYTPTDGITVKPANQPGYSKMLLREIKKLIELN